MELNEIILGICAGLTHDGLGIIKTETIPVFVSGLLPSEKAKVKITYVHKKYALGKLEVLLLSSQNRVMPICKKFGACGGCDLMHMTYQATLDFKKQMVIETLKRIGHLDKFPDPIIYGASSPLYYRNKVQIPFSTERGKVICGFYKRKTHNVIQLEQCFIQPEMATDIARFIKNLMNEFKISAYDEVLKKGNVRHILVRNNQAGEYLVVIITKEKELLTQIANKIASRYPNVKGVIQNINEKDNNVILGDNSHVLYGIDELIEDVLGVKYRLSHKSFFQINHDQTEVLYSEVLKFADLKSTDVVIDAYCGVGSISLLLAQKAKHVYGVEIVKEAIDDANYNKQLNNIKNATFYVGKAEDEIAKLMKLNASCIVVDPPRKGCDEKMISSILSSGIEKIVYVSCDPSTLARDLSVLQDKYNISKLSLVDMFCYASHIESVVLLTKK